VAANEYLGEQLDELRDAVRETMDRVVLDIHAAVGRVDATAVLSMWEGFGRFWREMLGMEPLVLVQAYGLQRDDPAPTIYPDAKRDEAESARWPRGGAAGGSGGSSRCDLRDLERRALLPREAHRRRHDCEAHGLQHRHGLGLGAGDAQAPPPEPVKFIAQRPASLPSTSPS
jgi:hypothetical protein